MNPQTRRLFFLALLSVTVSLAQTACSSKPAAPQTEIAATSSPSPTPDASASPSLMANDLPASANTTTPANNAANSSANTGSGGGNSAANLPPGNTSNPSMATSRPPVPAPTPAPPRVYMLESGTALSVWTTSTISTKTAKSGDKFTATLGRAITDGDWVVAKKGAIVEGTVVDSDPGGKVKGRAMLTLRLDRLTLADGRTVALDTSKFAKEAPATKKKDAMKVGIGAGIGAAIGAIAGGGKGAAIGAGAGGAGGAGVVMATRGDPAVIGSESQLSFRLTQSVKITQR